jgi:hypothetical protein
VNWITAPEIGNRPAAPAELDLPPGLR